MAAPEKRDINKIFDAIDLSVNESNAPFSVDENAFGATMKRFDPSSEEEFPADSTCVILGKRRTGKSHLAMDLLGYVGHKYKAIVALTGTKFNGFWQKVMPSEYIHEGYQEHMVQKLLDMQEKRVVECIEQADNHGEHKEDCDCNVLLILDDVASETDLRNSVPLSMVFTKGRHYKISCWLLSQYAYAMSPAIRANVDLAFILHQTQLRSKEAVADEFLSQIRRREAGDLLSKFAAGYQVLVVNNTVPQAELSQVLSIYEAPQELKQEAVGDEEYWGAATKRPEERGQQFLQEAQKKKWSVKQLGQFPHCLLQTSDGGFLLNE